MRTVVQRVLPWVRRVSGFLQNKNSVGVRAQRMVAARVLFLACWAAELAAGLIEPMVWRVAWAFWDEPFSVMLDGRSEQVV